MEESPHGAGSYNEANPADFLQEAALSADPQVFPLVV